MIIKSAVANILCFCKVLVVKTLYHRGKFSLFKLTLLTCMLVYLIVQPWTIIRSALTSVFAGYMFNQTTNNVLDSFADCSVC